MEGGRWGCGEGVGVRMFLVGSGSGSLLSGGGVVPWKRKTPETVFHT